MLAIEGYHDFGNRRRTPDSQVEKPLARCWVVAMVDLAYPALQRSLGKRRHRNEPHSGEFSWCRCSGWPRLDSDVFQRRPTHHLAGKRTATVRRLGTLSCGRADLSLQTYRASRRSGGVRRRCDRLLITRRLDFRITLRFAESDACSQI